MAVRKRDIFEQRGREDLLALVDRYELQVADRRVRENLIESLTGSRKVDLAEALGGLSPAQKAMRTPRGQWCASR